MSKLSKKSVEDLKKRTREIGQRLHEIAFQGASKNTMERRTLRKERAQIMTELNGRTQEEANA
jgi:ribosomal protein L29